MSEEQKTVYTRGADDGLVMGPLMALTVVLLGASTYVAWLAVPALFCAIGVPVLAYFRLAKGFRVFSAIWLHGICMFFFGGLVMAVVAFVAMRWVVPGFIVHQVNMIIDIYGSIDDPQAKMMVDTFEKLKSTGTLPNALDMTLELLYAAVFSGSLLSMIYALIIRRRKNEVFN